MSRVLTLLGEQIGDKAIAFYNQFMPGTKKNLPLKSVSTLNEHAPYICCLQSCVALGYLRAALAPACMMLRIDLAG
jgi:hypothetical protein